MKNFFVANLTAVVLMFGAILPAQAGPTTFYLQNIVFTDGTRATGSFDYDALTRQGSNFNISTLDGTLSAFTYTDANTGFYFGRGVGPNNFTLFAKNGSRYMNFSFANALTNAGGSWALNAASSYECMNCGSYRMVNAGSVTSLAPAAVPEPATLALLLPALGAMGVLVRRRKQAKA